MVSTRLFEVAPNHYTISTILYHSTTLYYSTLLYYSSILIVLYCAARTRLATSHGGRRRCGKHPLVQNGAKLPYYYTTILGYYTSSLLHPRRTHSWLKVSLASVRISPHGPPWHSWRRLASVHSKAQPLQVGGRQQARLKPHPKRRC